MDREKNVTYSLIFLNYDPSQIKDWVRDTKQSIIDSSEGYDYEFIEVKDVKGYVNAVNEGFARSKGKYLIVINDDVVINDRSWLKNICKPNTVMSWAASPFHMNGELFPNGACWSIPRELYEKIGGMDTYYAEGYGCDEVDYFYTAKEAGFEWGCTDINLKHMENKTYSSEYFINQKEAMTARNANYFYSKWKDKLNLQQ